MALSVFILSIFVLAYVYVGYFLLLLILNNFCKKPIHKCDEVGKVSIIIAAYNEEKNIKEKLDNISLFEWPMDRLEVIVGSDASDDETDNIVNSHVGMSVKLLRIEGRRGKTIVQNECAKYASGDILVFTDATTHLRHDALFELLRNFCDDAVGCVGGRLVYKSIDNSESGKGNEAYWSVETTIKQVESNICSLIGVSGCFYAVRKSLYTDIDGDLISDFVTALDVYKKGYRTVFEPLAVSEEFTNIKQGHEFEMRVRVALRSYWALFKRKELLNPIKFGWFAVQLVSHKVLRYAAPLFMISLFISNIFLLGNVFFLIIFCLQIVFYMLALLGMILVKNSNTGILTIPHYFVLSNLASLVAFIRFIKGDNIKVWSPVR